MKRSFLLAAALAFMGAGCLQAKVEITTFEQCAAAGNPVMESYPRQCRADGKTFVEIVAQSAPEPAPAGGIPGGGLATLVALGEDFTLKIGQFRGVQGGLRVTLEAIADSRCPKGVQCIWAGELAPKLLIELPDQDASEELTLGMLTKQKADALGYHFALIGATEDEATVVVTK